MSGAAHPPSGPYLSTDAGSRDPRIRGRTYAIPFETVWRAAVRLAEGGLPGWRVLGADANAGVIEAEATSRVLRRRSFVRIEVTLDEDAQTRVDLEVRALTGRFPQLGRNARFVGAYLLALDGATGANPRNILRPHATTSGPSADAVGRGRP